MYVYIGYQPWKWTKNFINKLGQINQFHLPFNASTLLVAQKKEHPARRNPPTFILWGSLSEDQLNLELLWKESPVKQKLKAAELHTVLASAPA